MECLRPRPTMKAAHSRQDSDLPRTQQGPRRHPAVVVVEIDITADVENALHHGVLGRMVDPRAAVQERHAAHPVGVVIDDEQIERLRDPANKREANVVEIPRAAEHQGRVHIRGSREQVCQRPLESPELPTSATQPNVRCPILHG